MTTLWRVALYGSEDKPASQKYAWSNRERNPLGQCTLQVVHAGQVLVRDPQGREHLAGPGQAFLFRFGEDSHYGFPPGISLPYRTAWIAFEGAGIPEHWDLIRAENGPVITVTPELEAERQRLTDMARPQARCDPFAMAAAVQSFILQLAASARESQREAQAPVERAVDDLLTNPAAPWSLKEVAERHGVSREHLTRMFQARIGQPPATWLNRARLDRAMYLLRQTDITLGDVVAQSGFSSAHTMARLIKRETGRSPSHFRTGRTA